MVAKTRKINIGSAVGHMMLLEAVDEISAPFGMLFSFGPGKDEYPSDNGHQFFIQEFSLAIGYKRLDVKPEGNEGLKQIIHPSPRDNLDLPGWVGYDPIEGLFVMGIDDDQHMYDPELPLQVVIITEHPRLESQWIVIHLHHDSFDLTRAEIISRRPKGMSENDAFKLIPKFKDKRVGLLEAATLLHRLHSAHASVDPDEDKTYAQA